MSKATTPRKAAKTSTKTVTKSPAKKTTKKVTKSAAVKTVKKPVAQAPTKVDIYPNRMTLAISALAGTMIVLLSLIAVLGSQ